jgi:sugar lactone lactonase YvrE
VLMGPVRARTGRVANLDQHRQVANSVHPPLAKALGIRIANYLIDPDGQKVNRVPSSLVITNAIALTS